MEWIAEINATHWFALGLILFAAEALGAAGFLLGAAAGALVLGLLTLVIPELSLAGQFGIYGVVSITATFLYLKVFRDEQDQRPDQLNHRAATLVGHEFDLVEALPQGESRLQIGDTFWKVRTDTSFAAGTRVKVVAADAMSLLVAAG